MKKLTFAVVFAALAFTTPARAETVNCTAITTLPYTISTQGAYCLTKHLSTGIGGYAGYAINITADNVVLDLNGFKLASTAVPGTGVNGIYALRRQNITIKNGAMSGFDYGILLDDGSPYTTSRAHVIEDIRLDKIGKTGMKILGYGSIIRNNQVIATGGAATQTTVNHGIEVLGSGAQVLNNMVTDVMGYGGIVLDSASNSVVAGNRIGSVGGVNIYGDGIYLSSSSNIVLRDNSISGSRYGIRFDSATGKYMNNMTQGVTIPYSGGTAAGATNY